MSALELERHQRYASAKLQYINLIHKINRDIDNRYEISKYKDDPQRLAIHNIWEKYKDEEDFQFKTKGTINFNDIST